MEFMWHGFPPSASCPLLLALLFMFARELFPNRRQPSRQIEAGSERKGSVSHRETMVLASAEV